MTAGSKNGYFFKTTSLVARVPHSTYKALFPGSHLKTGQLWYGLMEETKSLEDRDGKFVDRSVPHHMRK